MRRRYALAGVLLLALGLVGCRSAPAEQGPIQLPDIGVSGQGLARGVYAMIRRADLPLDQPTDDAWALVNEQVLPPMQRGTWRGNGLRVGVLSRDQLDRYVREMPEPVGFGETLISRSPHLVPIIQTPRLRNSLQLKIDLTRPPRPRQAERIAGGNNSTLRLLARIETDEQGQHELILIPQYHKPSPLNLIPRSPLEKELDGRVFDELGIRLKLGNEKIAVVGLHWPWPRVPSVPQSGEPDAVDDNQPASELPATSPAVPVSSEDPAAPPPHLRRPESAADRPAPTAGEKDGSEKPDATDPLGITVPEFLRVAPPLVPSFGSTLFTGTRIRQPVQTVLLITIEEPPDAPESEAN